MEPMPLPEIDYQTIPVGRTDITDYRALMDTLTAIRGMQPRRDRQGNRQAVVRFDRSPDGIVVTFPAAVDKQLVLDAIAASPPFPPPTVTEKLATTFAAVQPLDPLTVTVADTATAINDLVASVQGALAPAETPAPDPTSSPPQTP